MEYNIKITENGYIETLEIDGTRFTKEWTGSNGNYRSNDEDFCVQLECNGYDDDEVLDRIYEEIDCEMFASNLADILKEV